MERATRGPARLGSVMKETMNHSQKRRSPAQVRAGNLRLGLILLAIVAVFFLGAVLKQWLFH